MTDSGWRLPFEVGRVGTPPLKSQGIKTKLIPFIARNIAWQPGPGARWIEPFLGTGSVALNLAPPRALLSDANPHVIGVLRAIQTGELNPTSVRAELALMGDALSLRGQEFYYEVRDRFNQSGDPMDFLFLNRASFNGLIRFNRSGGFNTPFGHKPHRFTASFLTKVANQVAWTAARMAGKAWSFEVLDWRESVASAEAGDFVYLDPPYLGRNADYFTAWNDADAAELAHLVQCSDAGFALSMWLENSYRKNEHIDLAWPRTERRTVSHFYHLGATEALRNPMTEVLAIRAGYATELAQPMDASVNDARL